MNIYFGGSISGGRDFLGVYQKIVAYLKSKGHNVLTEHVVSPDVFELENKHTPQEVYERDIQWLESSDCLIAEVSNPSLGVGYEISHALNSNKPALCLYKKGIFLTRMLTGNNSSGLTVKAYESDEDWQSYIDEVLNGLQTP